MQVPVISTSGNIAWRVAREISRYSRPVVLMLVACIVILGSASWLAAKSAPGAWRAEIKPAVAPLFFWMAVVAAVMGVAWAASS